MKPIAFWPWYNFVLLFFLFICNTAVFYMSIKTGFYKKLVMLPMLSGFCMIENIVQFIIINIATIDASMGDLYLCKIEWRFYWSTSITANFLIVLMAINIITETIRLKYVMHIWCAVVALSLLIVSYILLPSSHVGNMLMVGTLADLVAVNVLLIVWIVPISNLPKGFTLVISGIVVSVVLDAVFSVVAPLLHTLKGLFAFGVPLASIAGSLFYLAAILLRDKPEKFKYSIPFKSN